MEKQIKPFEYSRRAYFYEMDAMGVMHHSVYLRVCEEARIEWLRSRKLLEYHGEQANCLFAVVDLKFQYRRPILFDQEMKVKLQTKIEGIRILFQYQIFIDQNPKESDSEIDTTNPVVIAQTVHAPVGKNLRPRRLPQPILDVLRRENWQESWL